MLAIANGQSGNTTSPNKNTDAQLVQVPVHSIYHDCLLAAGTSTWKELGLNSDQVDRVTALQTAYKAQLAEPLQTAGKGKAAKPNAATSEKPAPVIKPAEPMEKSAIEEEGNSATPLVEPMDKTFVEKEGIAEDNPTEGINEGQLSEGTQPVQLDPAVLADAQGSELASILTPEQWTRWQKQCSAGTPVGMNTK